MELTNYEKNIILLSLDYMEDHLFTENITEDTYNLRMEAVKSVRIKINNDK